MTAQAEHDSHIAFLLGKPLDRESILAEVVERLHHRTRTIILHRPDQYDAPPDWLYRSQLVVQRGLDIDQLSNASQLEQAGIRCCNRIAATSASLNRAHVLASIAAAGIRVPHSRIVEEWRDLLHLADRRPMVVKEVDGTIGRERHVVIAATGVLPCQAPFRGPYILQEYIPNAVAVQKIYVVGQRVRGLIKDASPAQAAAGSGIPFAVDADLKALARRCSSALDLEIAGVDVLQADDGPCVIDVNPFPGFRHVPDGARLIAGHLASLVVDTNAG